MLCLKADWVDTPLGQMIAVADEQALYLLEFIDHQDLENATASLRRKTGSAVLPERTPVLCSIEKELVQYFKGDLKVFKTPIKMLGTPFQKAVWSELQKIPSGETRSYSDIARGIGKPLAVRAVGQSNGANPLTLVVPCHRVIREDGTLGGYGGGIARKKALLSYERTHRSS